MEIIFIDNYLMAIRNTNNFYFHCIIKSYLKQNYQLFKEYFVAINYVNFSIYIVTLTHL